jgi:lysyl-tRNA synthetase class II
LSPSGEPASAFEQVRRLFQQLPGQQAVDRAALLGARLVQPQCTPTAPTPAAPSRLTDAGSNVRLSGWVHRKRDHGGLLFIDLRDHYGLTQLVLHPETPGFEAVERLRAESVIRVDGEVVAREAGP